jgi:3-phenylpropionate/cinnamic acid dioxygenase small subunit
MTSTVDMKTLFNPEIIKLRVLFEEILYYESSLLSSRELEKWTELLHDDIRYWVPVRSDRDIGAEDLGQAHLMCHIDDDKNALMLRAKRVAQGFGYTDKPVPRTRHSVTNVRVLHSTIQDATVTSNFSLWWSRTGIPEHTIIGCRNDRWAATGDAWLLIERQVLLDQSVISGMAGLF